MATKKEAAEDLKQNAVVPAGAPQLPAEMMSELEQYAGAGLSQSADDNVLPFLKLLQDMSPETKKRDPLYVEGAEPGCLYNTATKQLWKPDPEDGDLLKDADGKYLEVQPFAFDRCVNEWIPRNSGGGFVGRNKITEPTIEQQMLKLGGKAKPDEKNPNKTIWVTSTGNELIDTRYHYSNIIKPDGSPSPAVFAFASTGHQVSREWMTLMNDQKIGKTHPPSWFKKYRVSSWLKKGNGNEWFLLSFEDIGQEGWILDPDVRKFAANLYEGFKAGLVTAEAEKADVGGEGNVPF